MLEHSKKCDKMPAIYQSPFPPVEVPRDLSVSQFLLQCNPDDVRREKEVLVDFDLPSSVVTYGGLRAKAAQYAYALRNEVGLREGETVVIFAPNSVNWVLCAQSVMWAGGCFRCASSILLVFIDEQRS
jgi:long-subunit acyl-CoA synthetase (AMP-forming)